MAESGTAGRRWLAERQAAVAGDHSGAGAAARDLPASGQRLAQAEGCNIARAEGAAIRFGSGSGGGASVAESGTRVVRGSATKEARRAGSESAGRGLPRRCRAGLAEMDGLRRRTSRTAIGGAELRATVGTVAMSRARGGVASAGRGDQRLGQERRRRKVEEEQ